MGFVNQDNDVFTLVQVSVNTVKLVDERNDKSSIIRGEQFTKVFLASCRHDIRKAERFKVLEHLVFQLYPVHHNQDCRILKAFHPSQLVSGDYHRESFARTLRVPD